MNGNVSKLCLMIASAIFLFAGCASYPLNLGKTDVSGSLYKEPAEIEELTKQLSMDMTKDEVFAHLGITRKTPNLEILAPEAVQRLVYGQTETRGSPQEIEAFRARRTAFEGFRLPYKNINRSGWLGLPKWTSRQSGFDLDLYMIFDTGKLYQAVLAGTQKIDRKETTYVWELIGHMLGGTIEHTSKGAITP